MSHPRRDYRAADHLWSEFASTRDPRSRDALIHHYGRLAYALASRFRDRGVLVEDLSQVALLGLVKAVDRFDPTTGNQFSTFAVPTIMGEIRRHFRDHLWSVHVPRGLQELSQQVNRANEKMAAELGRCPTFSELAARLRVSEERVVEAMSLEELNQPMSLHGQSRQVDPADTCALEESIGFDDPRLQEVELGMVVDQALALLPVVSREVLRLRFMGALSQRAVGRRLGISQMQVCRLEKRALSELRHELGPAFEPTAKRRATGEPTRSLASA